MRRYRTIFLVSYRKIYLVLLTFLLCALFAAGCVAQGDIAALPILMYHHLDENASNSSTITPATFEAQLAALREAGFTGVRCADLVAYVDGTGTLPQRPLLITFDDGYKSNVDLAAPLLQAYGYCAAVHVIGVTVGQDIYPPTGRPTIPHFSFEAAAPWVKSGVLEIQSHSYDMHQNDDGGRQGVQPLRGESRKDYEAAFTADVEASRGPIEKAFGSGSVLSFAYPYGLYTPQSEALLTKLGIPISLTVQDGINILRRGQPGCLRLMKRIHVGENDAPGALAARLLKLIGAD